MKVILDGGAVIELGETEAAPTVGITDYSRRVTDDFGVTTVVERGFARRMSVRMSVPFEEVDALQSRLTALRAIPAQWVADDRFGSLDFRGFYKEFGVDLAVPPLSFCTLTVEGLVDVEPFADTGADPAPDGQASTLDLVQPVAVAGGVLALSSVPENDAAEWASGTNYALGARVIKTATHRVYESAIAGNVGNDPAGDSGKWSDIGATNRWAMFDSALGSATSAAGSITVTLAPGTTINAVALLDLTAASVRVTAAGYDRTQSAVARTSLLFLDLPLASGNVTVEITGSGVVSCGTLLLGPRVGLGITEASPTAGITDYSRKDVDDFGDVTIVPRGWSKRMAANALIRTDAVDLVANRIASVRARPSLWIGQAGVESLTIYGFFKDFSIAVDENVSKLSLSIEGLSKAAKLTSIVGDGIGQAELDALAAQVAVAVDLAKAAGNMTVGGPLPGTAKPGDTHVGDDGTFYLRVQSGGITLGGNAVTLAGSRPMLAWTLWPQQPLRAVVASAASTADAVIVLRETLAGLADDGILSRSEKFETLIPEEDRLAKKWGALSGLAASLGVTVAAANAARVNWNAYLAGLVPAWNDVTQDTPVDRAAFDNARSAFDAALYDLDRAIKAAASQRAIYGQVSGTPTALSDINGGEGSKLSGIGYGATRNVVTYSATAPALPTDGDLWVDTSGTYAVFRLRAGGSWQTGATALAAYNQLSGKPVALADINTTESGKLSGIQAGATVGAPAGTSVGSVAATDVASTVKPGGGVASGQVNTDAVIVGAISGAMSTTGAGGSYRAHQITGAAYVTLNPASSDVRYLILISGIFAIGASAPASTKATLSVPGLISSYVIASQRDVDTTFSIPVIVSGLTGPTTYQIDIDTGATIGATGDPHYLSGPKFTVVELKA